jgi:hypothetical protein
VGESGEDEMSEPQDIRAMTARLGCTPDVGVQMVAEIAAQLCELNQHISRIEFLLENVIHLNGGGLQVEVNGR